MENILLIITILLYIITAYILTLTVYTKQNMSDGYDVNWDEFRNKVPKWGIRTAVLGFIFNVIYILVS